MDGKEDFKKEMESQMKNSNSGRNLGLKDKAMGAAKNGVNNIKNKASNSLNNTMPQGENNSMDQASENLTNKFKDYAHKAEDIGGDLAKKGAKKGLKAAKNAIKGAKNSAKVAGEGAKVGAQAGAQGAGAAASGASAGASAAGTAAGAAGSSAAASAGAAGGAAATEAGAAAGSGVAAALPYILIAVAIIAVIIIVVLLLWWLINNNDGSKNKREGDYVTDPYGNKILIQPDWEDRLTLSYYAAFGDKAYYYTIDEDSTLHQAGTQEAYKVQDKYSRESSFALSTSLIKYLDETINDGISLPEQFIKPVYNTCSTGETKDGLCQTKPLVKIDKQKNEKGIEVEVADNAELIVKSQGYIEKEGTIDLSLGDEFPNGNVTGYYYEYDNNQSTIEKSQTISVSSWGLAPILHYKKYEEKRWAQDLHVTKVTYFDEGENKYKTCEYSSCPDWVKEDLTSRSEVKKVETGGAITEATINGQKLQDNKIDESSKNVYLIDNVATLVGTVGNSIDERTEKTGEKYYTDVVVKKDKFDYAKDTDSDILTNKEYVKSFKITPVVYKRTLNKTEELKDTGQTGYFPGGNRISGPITPIVPGNNNNGQTVEQEQKDAGAMFVQWKGTAWDFTGKNACVEVKFENLNGNLTQYKERGKSWNATLEFMVPTVNKNATITCIHEDGTSDTQNLYSQSLLNTYKEVTENETDFNLYVGIIINSVNDKGVGEDGIIWGKKEMNNFYSVEGDYWTTEYKYTSHSPSTDNLDNGKYLNAYIRNYEAYYTKNDWNEAFTNRDFKEIFDYYLKVNEGLTGEYDESIIEYNSEYGKLIMQLFGDKVFLRRDAFIASLQEEYRKAEEAKKNGETVNVPENQNILPIGKQKEDMKTCVTQLTSYVSPISGKNTYQLAKEAASEFGVDLNLFLAVGMQEGSCNPKNWKDHSFDNPSPGGAYGVWQMQVNVWRGKSISAYSYTKGQNYTLTMDSANADTNIKFGAMYLANLIKGYDGNVLMALQAYNWGSGGLNNYAIERYSKATGRTPEEIKNRNNMYDIGWLNYREGHGGGDNIYVENVLKHFDKMTIDVVINNGDKFTYDLSKLTGNGQFLVTSEDEFVANYIYWPRTKNALLAKWDLIFGKIKNKNARDIDTKTGQFPENSVNASHTTPYLKIKMDQKTSEEVINRIFAQTLAAVDGSSATDNQDLTDVGWKKKFTALFSSYGADALEEDIPDLVDYFTQFLETPIENNYVAYRKFGRTYNEKTESYESNSDIIMKTTYGKEVKAAASGVISGMSSDCITIDSTPDSEFQEIRHTAEIEYCNINIDSSLKIGNKVEKLSVLGRVKAGSSEDVDGESNEGLLYLGLILDGHYEDAEYILKIAEMGEEGLGVYSATDAMMQLASNETTKKFNEYAMANADILDEWLKAVPADFTKGFFEQTFSVPTVQTAGSGLGAYAPFGKAKNHDAVDQSGNATGGCTTGKHYCNNIYALANGVAFEVIDGNPDTGKAGGKPGNGIRVFYRTTNGDLIFVLYHHTAQGSLANGIGKQSTPIVKKGQWIGTMGNSGQSSGAHTHVNFLNFGKMSLAEAMKIVKAKGVKAQISFYNEGNLCRSSHGKYPCWEVPEEFAKASFNWNNPRKEDVCKNLYNTSAAWGNKNKAMSQVESCPDNSPAKTGKTEFEQKLSDLANTYGPLSESQQKLLELFGR